MQTRIYSIAKSENSDFSPPLRHLKAAPGPHRCAGGSLGMSLTRTRPIMAKKVGRQVLGRFLNVHVAGSGRSLAAAASPGHQFSALFTLRWANMNEGPPPERVTDVNLIKCEEGSDG